MMKCDICLMQPCTCSAHFDSSRDYMTHVCMCVCVCVCVCVCACVCVHVHV